LGTDGVPLHKGRPDSISGHGIAERDGRILASRGDFGFELLRTSSQEHGFWHRHNTGATIPFAINTGLRTSDIFNLEWTEVDIEQKRLKKIVKKNQWPLSLPLNDAAFEILERRRGIQHGPYVFL
jgi:hypothetical protein